MTHCISFFKVFIKDLVSILIHFVHFMPEYRNINEVFFLLLFILLKVKNNHGMLQLGPTKSKWSIHEQTACLLEKRWPMGYYSPQDNKEGKTICNIVLAFFQIRICSEVRLHIPPPPKKAKNIGSFF